MVEERHRTFGSCIADKISETGKRLCFVVNRQYEQALEDFLDHLGFGILFILDDMTSGFTEYQYNNETHMIRFSWKGERVFLTSATFDKEKQAFIVQTVKYYLGEEYV